MRKSKVKRLRAVFEMQSEGAFTPTAKNPNPRERADYKYHWRKFKKSHRRHK